jgi:hypothetical protein
MGERGEEREEMRRVGEMSDERRWFLLSPFPSSLTLPSLLPQWQLTSSHPPSRSHRLPLTLLLTQLRNFHLHHLVSSPHSLSTRTSTSLLPLHAPSRPLPPSSFHPRSYLHPSSPSPFSSRPIRRCHSTQAAAHSLRSSRPRASTTVGALRIEPLRLASSRFVPEGRKNWEAQRSPLYVSSRPNYLHPLD